MREWACSEWICRCSKASIFEAESGGTVDVQGRLISRIREGGVASRVGAVASAKGRVVRDDLAPAGAVRS